MYQPNVPAIYHELKRKNMGNMKTVLGVGTFLAVISYIFAGMFGYVTFAMRPDVDEIMNKQNILKADYGDPSPTVIRVCLFGILLVVALASPFALLPSKDSMEELLLGR